MRLAYTIRDILRIRKASKYRSRVISKWDERNGHPFFAHTVTNQIFPILPDAVIEKIAKDYLFISWAKLNGETAIRLVTSWATPIKEIDLFLKKVKEAMR